MHYVSRMNAAVEDETLLTTSTAPMMAMDGHEELMKSITKPPTAQALIGQLEVGEIDDDGILRCIE